MRFIREVYRISNLLPSRCELLPEEGWKACLKHRLTAILIFTVAEIIGYESNDLFGRLMINKPLFKLIEENLYFSSRQILIIYLLIALYLLFNCINKKLKILKVQPCWLFSLFAVFLHIIDYVRNGHNVTWSAAHSIINVKKCNYS